MNSFYSVIYNKFAELQISQYDSARFAYPVTELAPILKTGRRISDCFVGIPTIRIARNSIAYGPFLFEDSEFGQIASIKLIFASTALLSAKSIFRWLYRDYIKKWLANKPDPLRARYAMSIILDALARHRVLKKQGAVFYQDVIRIADALSVLLLPNSGVEYPVMAQAALASHILGIPTHLPLPVMKIIGNFLSDHSRLKSIAPAIADRVEETVGEEFSKVKISRKRSGWTELVSLANSLYRNASKIPGRWHNMYLPYSHVLYSREQPAGEICIFNTGLITPQDFTRLKANVRGLATRHDAVWQENFYLLVKENRLKERIMSKLLEATRDLNFGGVMFPICDYVSFYRMCTDVGSDITNISDRVRLVKNAFDSNPFEQVGNINLQIAIQAIASQSQRNDIFDKDEELLKEESWTILVDCSKSLTASSTDLKAVSVCLAETANRILGSNPWGMFAFSDELYCVKEFSEQYDNQIKARIGGLTVGGLSYIPDALRACGNLVRRHAKDRNFLIVVSDGVPSGYPNVDDEFETAVKELRRQGIGLIGIGIGGKSIKKTIRNARVIDKPSDIAKEFMNVYMSLSPM